MSENQLVELAKEADQLRTLKETLDGQLSAVKTRLSQILENELPALMEDQEISKFAVDGIGTIFLRTEVYSYVRSDDRPKFYDWLRETGNEGLIVPYVHPATQKAFIKEQLEDGVEFPEFISASFKPKAQIRRT